ncbi:TagD Cytidylyltransferase [Burkholderiales bacterium]|jgi:rfaE bifunctional protein nucleotidyltransferase chain/domain
MPPVFEKKIAPPDQLASRIESLAQPIVFTNGVFDLLHRGHVTYLAQARAHGASLIVAVNDDASTQRLGKGSDRPINALSDRLAVVAALECVSLVTWFSEDTPIKLIQAITPQVLVKGGDWPIHEIVGGDWVQQHGGQVLSIAFTHERSTTRMLERIRQR